MSNTLTYKNFYGKIAYSAEDELFCGKIDFINDLIMFEADNVSDLKKAFEDAVDDYLETCKMLNREPQKAFKGKFNVRVAPELHKKAALVATQRNVSLNKLVATAINNEVGRANASL